MQSVDFIMEVFRRLEIEKIKYGILRKSEEIEKGVAHDLDMALDFTHINQALDTLEQIAKEKGWIRTLCVDKDCGNLKTVHYTYLDQRKPEIIHYDFFNNFSWNGVTLLENQVLLDGLYKKGDLFCVSKVNEVAIKLLSRLIYHGYVKEEYKEDIQEYAQNNSAMFVNRLNGCLGKQLAAEIVGYCSCGNWSALEEKQSQIRKMCVASCTTVSMPKQFLFKMRRFSRPQGVMIAFLGTDGSGKSTIIEGLPDYLGNTFDKSQIKYYHWRPGFLKSPKGEKSGSKGNTEEPHRMKPYNKGISFLKFLYFNLDYILGYWFLVKKALAKNEMVIFDRYYYDYYVDKYRYRLDIADSMIDVFRRIIPKPDITFLLMGDPVILFERKQELSIAEIKQQIARLKHVEGKIPNSKVINVNRSIDEVIGDVSREILSYMARR